MALTLLVLGASSECGIQLIQKVHRNYEYIYAHYGHNEGQLQQLKSKLGEKLILIQADFSRKDSYNAVLEEMESCGRWPDHVVLFPAMAYQNVKFIKADMDSFEKGMQISVYSCIPILQAVIACMIKDKREGRIIFTLSLSIYITPKYTSPYVMVKYALYGLMKELSAEYADKGIMVNGISPGMMETKFLKNVPELIVQQNAVNSPFGRNLMVEEVIPSFEYLLSDAAARITGQNIVVSGGM